MLLGDAPCFRLVLANGGQDATPFGQLRLSVPTLRKNGEGRGTRPKSFDYVALLVAKPVKSSFKRHVLTGSVSV